jgi:hypothetical protein
MIGKAGLFQTVRLIGQPIAAVLRQDERDLDVRPLHLQSIPCPRRKTTTLCFPIATRLFREHS